MRNSILKLLTEYGLKPDKASTAADALLVLLADRLPKFSESEENASKHFNKEMFVDKEADLDEFYESLHAEGQDGWEGLMWGWNDCVIKIHELFGIRS